MGEGERRTRWSQIGGVSGDEYAARFAARAAAGEDVHGEAGFCAGLVAPGARVLDAGCGTGRVAARLHELGYGCVGVDADESMLAVARRAAPAIPWHRADLSALTSADLDGEHGFDLVVMAGNVVPLLAEGTLGRAMAALAGLLRPDGLLVAGFGLTSAHLPPRCPVTPLGEYDAACAQAGLWLRERYATWDGEPFAGGAGHAPPGADVGQAADPGYAVSVHRKGPGVSGSRP
jgi:SAM-dependent methyltransferase